MFESEQSSSLPAVKAADATPSSKTVSAFRRPRRLASIVSLTGAGSVLTMAIATLVNITVARTSGPAGYAVFFTSNMLVYVAAILFSCGLPLALSKHVASMEEQGHHEELRHSAAAVLLLLVMIAIVCGLGMSIGFPLLERYLHIRLSPWFAFAYAPVLLFAIMAEAIQGIYSGLFRPHSVIAITVSGPLMMLCYIVLSITLMPLPLWGAVATSYICSGLVAIFQLVRDRLVGFPSLHHMRPVLKDVAPSATFTFFTIFSAWSDRWAAAVYMSPEVSGSYFSAVAVIHAVLRLPTNIAYLLVPASTRIALRGDKNSKDFNQAVMWTYGLFSAMVVVTIMLAPSSIVHLLFGQKFSLAAPALFFMTPSLLCSAISIPIISTVTGSDRNKLIIYLLGLTFLPRLYMLSYFTYRWSYIGTAFAKVATDALLALLCLLLSRGIGMHFPLKTLAKPFFVGALAFGVGLGALLLEAPRPAALALALLVFTPLLWKTFHRARTSTD
ncbi:MAG: oligosaccharide flippase family protein [Pyrinomonadaceae bacterium]|nr:oligosaccharide flippase family protein [Pyrinomonadaceae bacterium]